MEAESLSNPLTGPILSRLRQTMALLLWEHRAFRVQPEEPFMLASGNRSPIYVNCRTVISDPDFLRLFVATASLLLERRRTEFTVVAGGETAGIPFAAVLAQGLSKPLVYVRKKAKGYGIANRVEGALPAGARVLLVEDLITDGGSKLGFLDAIADAGGQVTDALVLFDREQGGAELLAGRGVRLHSVTDRRTALSVGQGAGLLDEGAVQSIDDYFRDPVRWHTARGLPWQSGAE